VAGADRIKARALGCGFWQIEAHFGFAQAPNVPRELVRADIPGPAQILRRRRVGKPADEDRERPDVSNVVTARVLG